MAEKKYTTAELAAKIKAQYPQYKSTDDGILVAKIIEKYPQYKESWAGDEVKKKGISSESSDVVSTTDQTAPEVVHVQETISPADSTLAAESIDELKDIRSDVTISDETLSDEVYNSDYYKGLFEWAESRDIDLGVDEATRKRLESGHKYKKEERSPLEYNRHTLPQSNVEEFSQEDIQSFNAQYIPQEVVDNYEAQLKQRVTEQVVARKQDIALETKLKELPNREEVKVVARQQFNVAEEDYGTAVDEVATNIKQFGDIYSKGVGEIKTAIRDNVTTEVEFDSYNADGNEIYYIRPVDGSIPSPNDQKVISEQNEKLRALQDQMYALGVASDEKLKEHAEAMKTAEDIKDAAEKNYSIMQAGGSDFLNTTIDFFTDIAVAGRSSKAEILEAVGLPSAGERWIAGELMESKKKRLEESEKEFPTKLSYEEAYTQGRKGEFVFREFATQSPYIVLAMASGAGGSAAGLSTGAVQSIIAAEFGAQAMGAKYGELTTKQEIAATAKSQLQELKAKRDELTDEDYYNSKYTLERMVAANDISDSDRLTAAIGTGIIEGSVTRFIGTVPNAMKVLKDVKGSVSGFTRNVYQSNWKAASRFLTETGKRVGGEVIEETSIEALSQLNDALILGTEVDFSHLDDVALTAIITSAPMTAPSLAYNTVVSQVSANKYKTSINTINSQIDGYKKLLSNDNLTNTERAQVHEQINILVEKVSDETKKAEADIILLGSENVKGILTLGGLREKLLRRAGVERSDDNSVIDTKVKDYMKTLNKEDAKSYMDELNFINDRKNSILKTIDYSSAVQKVFGEKAEGYLEQIDPSLEPREKYFEAYNIAKKEIHENAIKEFEGSKPFELPETKHDNLTSETGRIAALDEAAEDGATMNLDGSEYTDGGLVVPVASMNTTQGELTEQMVADYIAENKDKIGDNSVKVGLYKFPNSNQVSIDLNIVVPKANEKAALEFGKQAGQESLFDLDSFENIKTGADGMNPREFSAEEFRNISKALSENRVPVLDQTTEESKEVQEEAADLETALGLDEKTETKEKTLGVTEEELTAQVDNARSALKEIAPDVKVVVHETTESFNKATQQSEENIGGIFDERSNTIHINKPNAQAATVSHEALHAILFNGGLTHRGVGRLTKAMVNDLKGKVSPELQQKLDKWSSAYDKSERNEEVVAQTFGLLASEYTSLDTDSQNIIRKWINQLAEFFGLKKFSEQEVVDFMNIVSGKIRSGETITKDDTAIVEKAKTIQKKRDNNFARKLINKIQITDGNEWQQKMQADFYDKDLGLHFVYDKNSEKFKRLENNYIKKDVSIDNFNGQYVVLHQPDNAFSGMITKGSDVIVEGKGGMYFPIKFHEKGLFWAATDKAQKFVNNLNGLVKKNGGKVLMGLTSAPVDKLLSSTTMSNAVLDFFASNAFDTKVKIKKKAFANAIVTAANSRVYDKQKGKWIGLNLGLKKSTDVAQNISLIKEALSQKNSNFPNRKQFSKALITEMVAAIKENPKAEEQFGKFFSDGIKNKYFMGKTKTGKYKLSATNVRQALSDMFSEPMLKDFQADDSGGRIYAMIEVDGEVEMVKSEDHESYPNVIRAKNAENKVSIHLIKDPIMWTEVTEDPDTNELGISGKRGMQVYPTTSGITNTVRLNTSNLNEAVSADQRKQTLMNPDKRNKMDMNSIVSEGRKLGYSDESIALLLKKQKVDGKQAYSASEIKEALAIPYDISLSIPAVFGNVKGGMNVGATLYLNLRDSLNKYASRVKNLTTEKLRNRAHQIIKKDEAFKDLSDTMKKEILVAVDESLKFNLDRKIAQDIKELKKIVRERKRGANELNRIKQKVRIFIRKSMPPTMWTKTEVTKLIKEVTDATEQTIDSTVDSVIATINNNKSEFFMKSIGKRLGVKTKKTTAGRVKGKFTVESQEKIAELKSMFVHNENTEAEKIEDTLNNLEAEYNKLDAIDNPTEQDLDEMVALQIGIEYNSALLLDNTDGLKVESLMNVDAMLKDFLSEQRSIYKIAMRDAVARYNDMKNTFFKEVAGFGIDFNSDESIKEARSKVKDKQNLKDNRPKALKALTSFFNAIDSALFVRLESLEGLLDRIGKLSGEVFGGKINEMILEKINESTNKYKKGKSIMEASLREAATQIFGKNHAKIMRKNTIRNVEVYTDPALVAELKEELENTTDKIERRKIQTRIKEKTKIMSQNEMYYYYNQFKDEANHAGFETDFGDNYKEVMADMESKLDPKVKEWADWQVDIFFPSVYGRYNSVYRNIYRANMPWNAQYAGRIIREGSDVDADMFDMSRSDFRTMVGSASTKVRIKNSKPIAQVDGDNMLNRYIDDMEYFAAYAENMRDINKVYRNPLVKDAIEATTGKDIYKIIGIQLDKLMSRQLAKQGLNSKLFQYLAKTYVVSKLAASPIIYIKQMTSALAFSDYIGYRNWMKYTAKELTNGIMGFNSTWKELYNNSTYLQERASSKDFSKVLESYGKEAHMDFLGGFNSDKVIDMLMYLVKKGDMAGIMGSIGNYSYYKDKFKKANPNATEQQAIDHAVKKTESNIKSTQQSQDIQDKGFYQTDNVAFRWLSIFTSSGRALLRKEIYAVRNLYRKMTGKESKGTVKQNVRTLLTYHIAIPLLFQWVSMGMPAFARELRDDDQDDLIRAMILGNLNSLLLIGDVLSTVADIIQDKPYAGQLRQVPALSQISQAAQNLIKLKGAKTEATIDKYTVKFWASMVELTGLPASQAVKFYNNFSKLIDGDFDDWGEAFLRAMNYSEYAIKGMDKKKKPSRKKTSKKDLKKYMPDLYNELYGE